VVSAAYQIHFELILDDGTGGCIAVVELRSWKILRRETRSSCSQSFSQAPHSRPSGTEIVEAGEEDSFISPNHADYPLTEGLAQRWLRSLIGERSSNSNHR